MLFPRPVICLIIFFLVCPGAGYADNYNSALVTAVVVSEKIKPYARALDGIKEAVIQRTGASPEVLWYSTADEKEKNLFEKNAAQKRYAIIIAVGPQATSYIWDIPVAEKTKRFYSVVFDPEKILGENRGCGISLKIPVKQQVTDISGAFPLAGHIALIFDPAFNSGFYEKAAAGAAEKNLTVRPVRVDTRKQIKSAVKDGIENTDLVWLIPDPTVISQSTVAYIIKYALKQRKGVIGYNRYFFESGAVFSFEFDYRAIGIQSARAAFKNYFMGNCPDEAPVYNTLFNFNVARKLNLAIEGDEK